MSYFEELDTAMDRYLEAHASGESPLLKALRRETYLKTTQPHMLSGYQQGRLLSIISKMLRPKNVLEIGTFTGYATLCLAEGLLPEGRLTTLDINSDLAYLAEKYLAESPFASQIDFKLINAVEFLQQSEDKYDLVFVDADKENYLEYFNLIKERVDPGAIVMFDNVLWYGNVLQDEPKSSATSIIQSLNKHIAEDPNFENVILPLRDGVNLLRRI